MANQDSRLNILSTISECSIAGFFQELLSKKTASNTTPELKLGDAEGSDFKRLMNKKKYKRISNTNEDTLIIEYNQQQQQQQKQLQHHHNQASKKYHVNSPDFRPVVHLSKASNSENGSNLGVFSGKFLSLFSSGKDRYFNNDREELSKDIFPVGYQ